MVNSCLKLVSISPSQVFRILKLNEEVYVINSKGDDKMAIHEDEDDL